MTGYGLGIGDILAARLRLLQPPHHSAHDTLFSLSQASIKPLLSLYEGSMKALLRLYEGSMKALYRLYEGCLSLGG